MFNHEIEKTRFLAVISLLIGIVALCLKLLALMGVTLLKIYSRWEDVQCLLRECLLLGFAVVTRKENRRECCLTRKELSQLYWLKKEIERESRRVEELEALATGCTAGASGMPGSGSLSDKTAIAVQIADCKTLIETKRRELVTEYNRLLHYIKDVDDAYIRNILKYRYIECLTWRQVALRMGGTASAVRMAHNRFFEKM